MVLAIEEIIKCGQADLNEMRTCERLGITHWSIGSHVARLNRLACRMRGYERPQSLDQEQWNREERGYPQRDSRSTRPGGIRNTRLAVITTRNSDKKYLTIFASIGDELGTVITVRECSCTPSIPT